MAIEPPTDFLWNFAKGFFGQRPVFSNGVRIGYVASGRNNLTGLCEGRVVLDVAGTKTDPKTWTTKDDLWRDVPVTNWCLKNGIKPNWLPSEEIATATQDVNGEITIPGKYQDKASAMSFGNLPLVVGGTVAGLGLLLLLTHRD